MIAGTLQSIVTQYRLVYQPPPRNVNQFQKITVEALRMIEDKREDFKVLAREGWR